MVNVFSYCIYGSQDKYCLGLIKNLEQIAIFYPDFETHIAVGNDVPDHYIQKYKEFKNTKLTIYSDITGGRLMSYRFFPIDNPEVDLMLSRDADSRLTERDRWCIDQFLKSDYQLFTIRDHIYHERELMGGQWGMRRLPKFSMQSAYDIFKAMYSNVDRYYSDQDFIRDYIYRPNVTQCVAYTSCYTYPGETALPIAIPRRDIYDFCGNVILFRKDPVTSELVEYFEWSIKA
jgi:hypothetical protein